MAKETEDVQNIISRLQNDIRLNVNNPSIAMKKKYSKELKKGDMKVKNDSQ